MTPLDRVALVLLQLNAEVAERTLARMPEHAATLRERMRLLKKTPASDDETQHALEEFDRLLAEAPDVPAEPEAPPKTETVSNTAGDPLAAVRLLPPERLAAALQQESPRTIALVLTHLDPARAGDVLKHLPTDLRRHTLPMLGKRFPASTEVLQRIAQAILLQNQTLGPSTSLGDPVHKLALMLRGLGSAERQEMLSTLADEEPETARAVRAQLFQWQDLLLIDDDTVRTLLAEVDRDTVVAALAGAAESIRVKIQRNVPEGLPASTGKREPTPAEIGEARRHIVARMLDLDERGELKMVL